jgi:endonuclease/exonuclease/phosphatase family metal-dependent hydrolase
MSGDTLRVLTFNLWWRFGPWEERLPAIVETIRALDPDIACLQEVWVADGTTSAHVVAEALGHHVEVAHRLVLEDVGFGNAVLSRWPIRRTAVRPLPSAGGTPEERLALMAEIDAPTEPIQVFCTHLNWRTDESAVRQAQVREISSFIADERPRGFPPILCGDFNADANSDEIRMLTGQAAVHERGIVFRDAWTAPGTEGPGWTWSNANPFAAAEHEYDRRIDYVLTGWRKDDGRGAPLGCQVVGDQPVGGVWPSDHLGVLAEIRLTPVD